MGLFGKKKGPASSEDSRQDDSKKAEIEAIEIQYREKQEELNGIRQKIEMVKEEYGATVSSLMSVKKELNYKNMELDVAIRKHGEISEKIKKSKEITDSRSIGEFDRTEENLSKIKQDRKRITKEYETIKGQVAQEQSSLRITRDQHAEYKKELEEARSSLYNAKAELEKQDHSKDAGVLTSKEKELILGDSSGQSSGIIEAASAVVGSLKSKLSMTQKELEAVQLLLEKERDAHEKTRQQLKKS